MFDPQAPSSRRALEELEKSGVRLRLLWILRKQARSDADAEDLIASALVRVCDPERSPWDPAARTFVQHMAYVMRDLAIEDARTWSARNVVMSSALVARAAEDIADGAPLADEALAEHESVVRLHGLGAILEARLANDALALGVFRCRCAGIEGGSDQAAHLGCTVAEIYAAQRRLNYQGDKVLAEERAAGRRVMVEAIDRPKRDRKRDAL